jgi:hypothetical protein
MVSGSNGYIMLSTQTIRFVLFRFLMRSRIT